MAQEMPVSAAAFFAGLGYKPEATAVPWAARGWFVGPDRATGDGATFDWFPPPTGFTVEDAHEWVTGVHSLYCHWESVGWSWFRANRANASALTNVYLLVEDLRRRWLLP